MRKLPGSILALLVLLMPGIAFCQKPVELQNTAVETKSYKQGQLVIGGWGDWFFDHCCDFEMLRFVSFETGAKPLYEWTWEEDLSESWVLPPTDPVHCTAIVALDGDQKEGEGSSVFVLQEFTVPRHQAFELTMQMLLDNFTEADRVAIMCGVPLRVVEPIISGKYPAYVPKDPSWGVAHTCLSGEYGVTNKSMAMTESGAWRWYGEIKLEDANPEWARGVEKNEYEDDVHVLFFDEEGWLIGNSFFEFDKWQDGVNAFHGEIRLERKPATFHIVSYKSWAGG